MQIDDCPRTKSGSHILELRDDWGEPLQWPWCRMCGLEIPGILISTDATRTLSVLERIALKYRRGPEWCRDCDGPHEPELCHGMHMMEVRPAEGPEPRCRDCGWPHRVVADGVGRVQGCRIELCGGDGVIWLGKGWDHCPGCSACDGGRGT